MVASRFFFIVTGFLLIVLLISYLLHRSFPNKRYPKYAPSLSLFALAFSHYFQAVSYSRGSENLGQLVLALILVGGALSGLLMGLFIDYLAPLLKNRHRVNR